MSNALTPEQQRAMVAAHTIPLPEPAFGFLVVSGETGQWIGSRAGEAAFDADNLRTHAAAVSADLRADNTRLQNEIERLRAEVEGLREDHDALLQFAKHVRRYGDTGIASMAIAVLAARKGEATTPPPSPSPRS